MSFQIVRYFPTYCPFTDARTGTKAQRLPMSYSSEALAHKLAGRMETASYESCGDDVFAVIPYGGDVWRDKLVPNLRQILDDIVF